MAVTDKAKKLADAALARVGKYAETAREKAPDVIDRAADVAGKAVDKAASGVDRATGGRYRDRLANVHAKVDEALGSRGGASGDPGGTATPQQPGPGASPSTDGAESPSDGRPGTPRNAT